MIDYNNLSNYKENNRIEAKKAFGYIFFNGDNSAKSKTA